MDSVPEQSVGSDEFRIINITAGGTTPFGSEQSVSAPVVPVEQPQPQVSPPSGGGNNRAESVDEAVRALMNISKFPGGINTGGGGTELGPTPDDKVPSNTSPSQPEGVHEGEGDKETATAVQTPLVLTKEPENHSDGLEDESTIEGSSAEHSDELSDEPSEFDSGSECGTEAMIAKGCMYTILQSLFVTTDDAKDNVADLLKRLVIAVEALKPAPAAPAPDPAAAAPAAAAPAP
jgi:hypothetical protein